MRVKEANFKFVIIRPEPLEPMMYDSGIAAGIALRNIIWHHGASVKDEYQVGLALFEGNMKIVTAERFLQMFPSNEQFLLMFEDSTMFPEIRMEEEVGDCLDWQGFALFMFKQYTEMLTFARNMKDAATTIEWDFDDLHEAIHNVENELSHMREKVERDREEIEEHFPDYSAPFEDVDELHEMIALYHKEVRNG